MAVCASCAGSAGDVTEGVTGGQAPAHPQRQATSAFAQHSQELLPIAGELRRPYARNRQEACFIGRPLRGHAREDCVAEHDVGGHAFLVGECAAQGSQTHEQLDVGGGRFACVVAGFGRRLGWPHQVDEPDAATLVARRAAGLDGLVEVGDQMAVAAARKRQWLS